MKNVMCGIIGYMGSKPVVPVLLEGLQRELAAPATVDYITNALTTALNRAMDERPRRQAEALTAQETAKRRLANLVAAVADNGASPALLDGIREHEAELARLTAEVASLEEPLKDRLTVMPVWVQQQFKDLTGLLSGRPQRTNAEFSRLAFAWLSRRSSRAGSAFCGRSEPPTSPVSTSISVYRVRVGTDRALDRNREVGPANRRSKANEALPPFDNRHSSARVSAPGRGRPRRRAVPQGHGRQHSAGDNQEVASGAPEACTGSVRALRSGP
jgi:hypothetical protein